jgi:hypothetical protein
VLGLYLVRITLAWTLVFIYMPNLFICMIGADLN